MSKEAMKLALEALEQLRTPLRVNTSLDAYDVGRAITALREALAEQPAPVASPHEQEPVGMIEGQMYDDGTRASNVIHWASRNAENDFPVGTLLYTFPPAQRKPLTDEQIDRIADQHPAYLGSVYPHAFARAIEAAHGIGVDK